MSIDLTFNFPYLALTNAVACTCHSVADPRGMPCPPPWIVKIGQKKMATECSGLYFMFVAPVLSEVSGSATAIKEYN